MKVKGIGKSGECFVRGMPKKDTGKVRGIGVRGMGTGQEVKAFAVLVREQRNTVAEVLQLWGDFPQGVETACSQDWQHVLAEHTSGLYEQLRFDESDPAVIRQVRIRLARIVATCQAWDKAIVEEG